MSDAVRILGESLPLTSSARSVLGALDELGADEHKLGWLNPALSIAGLVGGYLVGRKYDHPVLGAVAGSGAGHAVARAATKHFGLAAMAAAGTAAGTWAALSWRAHPALGYVLAGTGASVVVGIPVVVVGGKSFLDKLNAEQAKRLPAPATSTPPAPTREAAPVVGDDYCWICDRPRSQCRCWG